MGHTQKKQGIPPGTSEIFGNIMNQRIHVINVIESIYREFGFDPLSTPVLEHADVFKGHHGEGEELLFNLYDKKLQELVLRYDLTVPLARYISDHYEDAPIPFKRYQIATVFRDDEVDKGHFREFTQCDGDVVGISDLTADAEVISMAHAGLSRIGFDNFLIKINHRQIISSIAEKSGSNNRDGYLQIQRALDAVSKFAEKYEHGVDDESQSDFTENIQRILKGRNLTDQAIDVICSVFVLSGSFNDAKLLELEKYLSGYPNAIRGINDLREIVSYLDPDVKKSVYLDLSLARGADYYTGFILEGSIPNIPVGAVLGGGRFDNLVRDLGGPDLPAVGMAFGLERIIVSLNELGINSDSVFSNRVIVAPRSSDKKQALLNTVRRMRKKGINVDYIPMFSLTEDDVAAYAKKRGFAAVVTDNDLGLQIIKIKENCVIDGFVFD